MDQDVVDPDPLGARPDTRWTGRRLGRAAVATVALLVAATGCSGDDDGGSAEGSTTTTEPATTEPAAPVEPEVVDPTTSFADFADLEPPADAPNGRLLRVQDIPLPDGDGARHRILYRSETVTGEPTVVTGMVTVPPGDAPDGGWRLVSHAHGSTGLADDCAPSAAPDAGIAAEALLVQTLGRNHGAVVVSTDYEGQGGPGRHPFLLGESEGRSVLDAARAATQLPDVEVVDGEVALVGYSQGGHATLWANQIAADYAPDLTITGVLAGAPASEVRDLAASVDTFGGPGLLMVVAGLATGDPDADLDGLLTDDGRELLAAFDESCSSTPDPALAEAELFRSDPSVTEPWAGLVAASEPGSTAGAGPVLIVHGDADVQVPVAGSEALVARMCEAETVVERRVEPGAGHVDGAIPAYEQGFDWLDGLADGTPPVDDCAG